MQRVLITGAAGGLGEAMAVMMAREGARLALTDIAGDRVAALAERINAEIPGAAFAYAHDVADEAQWEQVIAAAVADLGGLSVLVNNAGVFEAAAVDGDDGAWADTWERTLRINLTAVGDLCRAAIGAFKDQGGGIIVNIASRAAFRGDGPDYMAYAASKGGVVALTRTIARAWAAEAARRADKPCAWLIGLTLTAGPTQCTSHPRPEGPATKPLNRNSPAGRVLSLASNASWSN